MLARYHCLMFPRSFRLTKDHVNELRDILVHATGGNQLHSPWTVSYYSSDIDVMTSTTSTVPYSVDDLQKMLNLLNHLTGGVFFVISLLLLLRFLVDNMSSDFQGTTCVLSKFPIY